MLESLLQNTSIIDIAIAATPYVSGGLILLYIILGLILNYHWKEYAGGFVRVQMFRVMYLAIGGIIIVTMLGASALI